MCEELFIKNCNENNIDEAKKIYNIDLNIDFNQLFLELEGLFIIFGYNSLEFVYLQILE